MTTEYKECNIEVKAVIHNHYRTYLEASVCVGGLLYTKDGKVEAHRWFIRKSDEDYNIDYKKVVDGLISSCKKFIDTNK